jgi:hypothetical protein
MYSNTIAEFQCPVSDDDKLPCSKRQNVKTGEYIVHKSMNMQVKEAELLRTSRAAKEARKYGGPVLGHPDKDQLMTQFTEKQRRNGQRKDEELLDERDQKLHDGSSNGDASFFDDYSNECYRRQDADADDDDDDDMEEGDDDDEWANACGSCGNNNEFSNDEASQIWLRNFQRHVGEDPERMHGDNSGNTFVRLTIDAFPIAEALARLDEHKSFFDQPDYIKVKILDAKDREAKFRWMPGWHGNPQIADSLRHNFKKLGVCPHVAAKDTNGWYKATVHAKAADAAECKDMYGDKSVDPRESLINPDDRFSGEASFSNAPADNLLSKITVSAKLEPTLLKVTIANYSAEQAKLVYFLMFHLLQSVPFRHYHGEIEITRVGNGTTLKLGTLTDTQIIHVLQSETDQEFEDNMSTEFSKSSLRFTGYVEARKKDATKGDAELRKSIEQLKAEREKKQKEVQELQAAVAAAQQNAQKKPSSKAVAAVAAVQQKVDAAKDEVKELEDSAEVLENVAAGNSTLEEMIQNRFDPKLDRKAKSALTKKINTTILTSKKDELQALNDLSKISTTNKTDADLLTQFISGINTSIKNIENANSGIRTRGMSY